MKSLLVAFRWLLFPFSCVYALITTLRNWLYNRNLLKSHSFPIPVICVGNLTVGGTGKTPHTEYLIRLLKGTHSIATLSRGYGRKTTGFRWATSESTAEQIGDEPLQFYQKFGSEIRVAVCEDRALAIRNILPTADIIVLDDAFQHRRVTPLFSILLTDYHRLFYEDFLLPTGNLRETRRGAHRAHCIIVSKCPDNLTATLREKISAHIRNYALPTTPIFFTSIRYGTPIGFSIAKDTIFSKKVILVSGIAQAGGLEKYVSEAFECQEHVNFNDHHTYTQADITKIQDACLKANVSTVITTEKDYVKLVHLNLPSGIAFYYLPIEIYFLFDEQALFNQLILQQLKSNPTLL